MTESEQKDREANLLQLRPDMVRGFRLIGDWDRIPMSKGEQEAYQIFSANQNSPDAPQIRQGLNPIYLISYLRYDFKKIMIRTRQLYVDNNMGPDSRLILPEIGCGFFEPLLICLSCTETLGEFRYDNDDKESALVQGLTSLGSGYDDHAEDLRSYYRNGLAHEFRPHGGFHIDLNTEDEYRAPYRTQFRGTEVIKIDIPHFIDALVVSLEEYISSLQSPENGNLVSRYVGYLNRREQRLKRLQKRGTS